MRQTHYAINRAAGPGYAAWWSGGATSTKQLEAAADAQEEALALVGVHAHGVFDPNVAAFRQGEGERFRGFREEGRRSKYTLPDATIATDWATDSVQRGRGRVSGARLGVCDSASCVGSRRTCTPLRSREGQST